MFDNEVTIVIVFNQMMVNSGLNVDSPDISHQMLEAEMDITSGKQCRCWFNQRN